MKLSKDELFVIGFLVYADRLQVVCSEILKSIVYNAVYVRENALLMI